MSKFTVRCSDAVALARTNFFICHCVKLGCGTHDRFVECGTSASVSLDGKWQIYFGKNANPMVLLLSCMCVSHRDTPVPTEDTTSLQPSPSRLQVANLCENGRAHTIRLFVLKHVGLDVFLLARTSALLSMRNLPERHKHFSVARWHVADLPQHDSNPMALRLSGMCVCHHATPVPPRTRHHCGHRHHCVHRRRRGAYLRLTTSTDSRNYVYSFENPYPGNMYASTFMRLCTVWLDSELCSFARCGEFTMGRRCSRHDDTSSVSEACSLAVLMFWQAPRRTQNHWNRRRPSVGKTGSDIHAAITWMSVRLKGQLL